MMKNIRLVIFDLDGTLIDAYQAIISSFNHTMKELAYPLQSDLVIRRAVGWGDENLLKPFVGPSSLKKALRIYRRHHKESLLKWSRLLPSASEVLECLQDKGYIVAVASNRPTRFSRILIRHLGLTPFFDYVLCADRLKQGKPHPEILKRIMRLFSCRPIQTLYVGDMTIDAMTGKAAGVKTIIVTTGSSSRAAIKRERPYRIIRSLKPLLRMC